MGTVEKLKSKKYFSFTVTDNYTMKCSWNIFKHSGPSYDFFLNSGLYGMVLTICNI